MSKKKINNLIKMDNYINSVIELIKSGVEDDIILQILDSVPSDHLHIIFEDRDEKIQKFKHIYNDILSIKRFENITDTVLDINVYNVTMSEKLYLFIKSINDKRTNKSMYFDNILDIFDSYIEKNNIPDSYNDKIYKLFEKKINILNYSYLNRFRRGLLISSELEK